MPLEPAQDSAAKGQKTEQSRPISSQEQVVAQSTASQEPGQEGKGERKPQASELAPANQQSSPRSNFDRLLGADSPESQQPRVENQQPVLSISIVEDNKLNQEADDSSGAQGPDEHAVERERVGQAKEQGSKEDNITLKNDGAESLPMLYSQQLAASQQIVQTAHLAVQPQP